MRILWMSNSPWSPTGYGAQTKHMLPLLRGLGHDVACFAYWGLEGSPIEWEGFKMYPPLLDIWGNDAVRAHLLDYEADALMTLFDPFVLENATMEPIGWKWFPHVPIDCDGLPRGMDCLEHARFIIAMSEHGRIQLLEAGYDADRIMVIPHGVDCEVHTNRTEEERRQIRANLGLDPDWFIVGMVQANKGTRKAIDAQLRAFAEFAKKNDDAHLYLHVEPTAAMGGIDIEYELEKLGLLGQGRVHRTGLYRLRGGVSEPAMSDLYSCFDVLLQCTQGEGFGIPIIEAQANGVPVIVNDCSAMPELVANKNLISSRGAPIRGTNGGTQYRPDHDAMVEKLQWLYKKSWPEVATLRNDAREYAEQFAWPRVAQRCWKPMMALVQDAVAPRVFTPTSPVKREVSPLPSVGLLCGPRVESPEIAEFVSGAHSTVVVLCPPDQVNLDCDGYIVLDEVNYAEEDLDQVVQKPFIRVLVDDLFGRKDLLESSIELITTSKRLSAALIAADMDREPMELLLTEVWRHLEETLWLRK